MNKDHIGPANRPLSGWSKRFAAPAVIALISIVLALGDDALRELGRFEREGLITGEVWRLVTGHLVHLGWPHLWMNLAALAILVVLFERQLVAWDWLGIGLAAALSIDAGLWWFESDLDWYVGLSGVLHGLMLAGGLRLVFERMPLGIPIVLSVVAKLAWEQVAGPLPFSEATAGGVVVIAAHLYGAVGGLVWFALATVIRRRARPRL